MKDIVPDNLLLTKFKFFAGIIGYYIQFFFNAQELVVFCHTVGATCRAGFYLSAVERYSEVGNSIVFCFSASVAHDGIIAVALGKAYGIYGFGKGAYLVYFYQQAVAYAFVYTALQAFYIGYKQVIAH